MPQFTQTEIRSVAKEISPFLKRMYSQGDLKEILDGKNEVLERYQPVFLLENLDDLTAEEYRSFLIFKNNKHWQSLQRMGPAHTANMDLLRSALKTLADEGLSLEKRLDTLLPPDGSVMVSRLGTATITPILQVMFPEKYGVLNKPVEDGLRKINLWPSFSRKTSFSEKYIEVNDILTTLAAELEIDLWTLDTLWWFIILDNEEGQESEEIFTDEEIAFSDDAKHRFGLEIYLQEFMRDNWDAIPELKDWQLFEQDGDIVGFEYNTNSVGRIDLLAHHKTEPRWLVIELKRDQSSDKTIGQVLRYMGWVDQNLAENGEEVFGLIISHSADKAMQYALKHTRNIDIMLYDVQFKLERTTTF